MSFTSTSSTTDESSTKFETPKEKVSFCSVKPRYAHMENAVVYLSLAGQMLFEDCDASLDTVLAMSLSQKMLNYKDMVIYDKSSMEAFIQGPNDRCFSDMHHFAKRIALALRAKYPCYVLALEYIKQLKRRSAQEQQNSILNPLTFTRIVIAAIVVTVKFYDDVYFSNEHYAEEFGVSLRVMNQIEIAFLVLLDFNLNIFDEVCCCCEDEQKRLKLAISLFDCHRMAICRAQGSPVLCGLGIAQLPTSLNIRSLVGISDCSSFPSVDNDDDENENAKIEEYVRGRELDGFRYDAEEQYLCKINLSRESCAIFKLTEQFRQLRSRSDSRKGGCASFSFDRTLPQQKVKN